MEAQPQEQANAWECHPDVLSRELVFAGTRVPVWSLFDHLEAGDSLDDFLEGFPSVTKAQAVVALDARRQIEAGIADLNAGRRHSHNAIKREFGVK
jgi:uncharacterized protein (DUF433 family)